MMDNQDSDLNRTEGERAFVEQLYEQAVEEFSKVAALIIPSPEAMALRDAARRRRFEESESSFRVA